MSEYERGFVVGLAHGRNLEKIRRETTMSKLHPIAEHEPTGLSLGSDGQLRHGGYNTRAIGWNSDQLFELLADGLRRVWVEIQSFRDDVDAGAADKIEVRNLTERTEALEIERTEGIEVLADRVAAVEAMHRGKAPTLGAAMRLVRTDAIEAHIADQKYQYLLDRLSALEERQEATVTIVNEHEKWVLEEIVPRLSALEDRQQDEAEFGGIRSLADKGFTPPTQDEAGEVRVSGRETDDYVLALRREAKSELAREIVERAREHTNRPALTGTRLAEDWHELIDWIEREFGGE